MVIHMIPKIIHHIGPKEKLRWNKVWIPCYESWKRQFPTFKFMFWNDESGIDSFIKDYYSDYHDLYQSFPRHIMKIDFARLCILHKFGGIYADLDLYCYKNFYLELNDGVSLVNTSVGTFENHLMVSNENNSFWLKVLETSKQSLTNEILDIFKRTNGHSDETSQYILNTTGPGLITKCVIPHETNILPFAFYTGHHLTYDHRVYTRHMLTGQWGKEDMERLLVEDQFANMQDRMAESYKNFRHIDINTFSFYQSYKV